MMPSLLLVLLAANIGYLIAVEAIVHWRRK